MIWIPVSLGTLAIGRKMLDLYDLLYACHAAVTSGMQLCLLLDCIWSKPVEPPLTEVAVTYHCSGCRVSL